MFTSQKPAVPPPTGSCANYWSLPDLQSYCRERMLPEPGAKTEGWTKKELLPYAAMYDAGMPRSLFKAAYEDVGRASEMNLEPMRKHAKEEYGVQLDGGATKAQVLQGIIVEITKRRQGAAPGGPAPKEEGAPGLPDMTTFGIGERAITLPGPFFPHYRGAGGQASPVASDADVAMRSVSSLSSPASRRGVPGLVGKIARGFARPPRPQRRQGAAPRTLVGLVMEDPVRAQELLADLARAVEERYPEVASVLGGAHEETAEEAAHIVSEGAAEVSRQAAHIRDQAEEALRTIHDTARQQFDTVMENMGRIQDAMDRMADRMRRLGLDAPREGGGPGPGDGGDGKGM